MQINIDPELIVGTKQAARILQMEQRSVRRKIADGLIPGVKIGDNWYVNKKALYVYLKGKEYRAQAQKKKAENRK